MARRINLPRLTQRQRMAKWQRERRQQAIYLGAFSAVLLFALGLIGWAAASSYYDENLRPAARVADTSIPMRDFNERWLFEKVVVYEDYAVPRDFENDPEVVAFVRQFRKSALDAVVLRETLLRLAREEGTVPTEAEVRAQLERDFGEINVRHILIAIGREEVEFGEEGEDGEGTENGEPAEPLDPEEAEARALARAEEILAQLRADPRNDQLWGTLAAEHSADPGSAQSGGDLGWVNARSGFVPEFEEAMFALADGEISEPVRSQFGFHIIQRVASRSYRETSLYARLRASGFGDDALMRLAEAQLLHERYDQRARAQEIVSPQPQLHLARIVITLPPPNEVERFTQQLARIEQVREGIREGVPFEQLAFEHSDDASTSAQGGDMGWVTRDMLFDRTDQGIADDLFGRTVGEVGRQHVVDRGSRVVFFKILDRYDFREVDEEQQERLRATAFDRWLFEQERRLGVVRLIPGLEF